MEIVKTNENYSINDVLENGWKMTGSATNEVNGHLNVWFNLTDDLGGEIANCNYYRYNENNKINFSVNNIAEENRDAVMSSFDYVMDTVLEHFKNN